MRRVVWWRGEWRGEGRRVEGEKTKKIWGQDERRWMERVYQGKSGLSRSTGKASRLTVTPLQARDKSNKSNFVTKMGNFSFLGSTLLFFSFIYFILFILFYFIFFPADVLPGRSISSRADLNSSNTHTHTGRVLHQADARFCLFWYFFSRRIIFVTLSLWLRGRSD